VSARSLCRAGSRPWQRRLPWPGPAPAAPRSRGPVWSPGTAPAQGLSSMAPSIRLSPAARSLFDEPLAIAVQVKPYVPRPAAWLSLRKKEPAGETQEGGMQLCLCPVQQACCRELQPQQIITLCINKCLERAAAFWRSYYHRIVQVERDLKCHIVQPPCNKQGHLQLDQIAQSRIQPGLGCFQAWDIHRLSGQPGTAILIFVLFAPGEDTFPGIIDIHGLGGGLFEPRASLLANHGFATLALAYYQFEDLPQEPKELHLEYFEEGVNYMLQHPQVKGPGVGLLGFSKGAEVCLAMAAFLKNILAVASLNAPVAVTLIPLSYKDKIIPNVTLYEHKAKATNSKFLDYSDVIDDPFQAPGNQSRIPLEKGEAQFLFMVGQDDHVVKSEYYATEVCKLLQAQGKENFQILSYPGTGHCIDPPFFPLYHIGSHPVFHKRAVLGGELRAYSKAQLHAWSQIQAFFKKYL
ncbi:ACOT5 thioesterase, partial [Emberiza fucata]|nr:ACOT5 thioesterase [Emberiza fucata]